jgi:hypothetical protein
LLSPLRRVKPNLAVGNPLTKLPLNPDPARVTPATSSTVQYRLYTASDDRAREYLAGSARGEGEGERDEHSKHRDDHKKAEKDTKEPKPKLTALTAWYYLVQCRSTSSLWFFFTLGGRKIALFGRR